MNNKVFRQYFGRNQAGLNYVLVDQFVACCPIGNPESFPGNEDIAAQIVGLEQSFLVDVVFVANPTDRVAFFDHIAYLYGAFRRGFGEVEFAFERSIDRFILSVIRYRSGFRSW